MPNKHKTKQEFEAEPLISLKDAKSFINLLIGDDRCEEGAIGRAMLLFGEVNKESQQILAVLCSNCAKKMGVKKCAGCSKTSQVRYCSKECQVAAWPSHKGSCGL